jgi:hypothetical protein
MAPLWGHKWRLSLFDHNAHSIRGAHSFSAGPQASDSIDMPGTGRVHASKAELWLLQCASARLATGWKLPMTPAQALIELKTHPRKWLEKHHVKAYAGVPATFSAQQLTFGNTGYVDVQGLQGPAGGNVFDRSPGTAKSFGPWSGKDRRAFTFDRAGGQAGFVGPTVQAAVVNIPVIASAAVQANYANIGLHDLGTALGRDFAVTTLLNGCSFVIDGANPSVCHVQPTGGTTSGALRNALQPHYGVVFGGGGNEYDHNVEDVTIIGIRRGGGWKIYAQVHTRNLRNVLRVVKLHG